MQRVLCFEFFSPLAVTLFVAAERVELLTQVSVYVMHERRCESSTCCTWHGFCRARERTDFEQGQDDRTDVVFHVVNVCATAVISVKHD